MLTSKTSSKLSNYLIFLVILLATLLRFIGLSHPKAYIFDEVYHAYTAKEYLHGHIEAWEWWTTPPPGVAYEWTHPPIAKYGMELGMLIFGETEFGYRSFSAVFGVLSIYGLYLVVFHLTKRRELAILSAFFLSIEGTHIAQSRIAMNDIYMLNFYIWSLYAALKSNWKLAAVLYGLALGSKWSALYGIVPLAYLYLYQNLSKNNATYYLLLTISTIRYLLITLAVYILTFTPFILAGHTWQQWWELHRQMWYYHTHLVATHNYQSTPLQWVFGARPVWYWVEYGTNAMSNIYVQGNPVILWLGLVALIMLLRSILRYPYTLLYLLYGVFVLPWIFSPRIMFYYHYLPSITFLTPLMAAWVYTLPKYGRLITFLLSILGLLLVGPMLFGFALPSSYWQTLFAIFPTWK